MRITTVTHVTLDGVMQGLGGPDEDRSGGFTRGGWAMPYFSGEGAAYVTGLFDRADGFLFGRRTFEVFAGHWGPQGPDVPIAGPLNTRPKYVVSGTLGGPGWVGTEVLPADEAGLAAALDRLRSGPDGEVQVHGSRTLVQWLLARRLVDELVLLTYPVVLGQGARLFPAEGVDTAYTLVDSRTAPTGVTLQTFRPTGRPEYGG